MANHLNIASSVGQVQIFLAGRTRLNGSEGAKQPVKFESHLKSRVALWTFVVAWTGIVPRIERVEDEPGR